MRLLLIHRYLSCCLLCLLPAGLSAQPSADIRYGVAAKVLASDYHALNGFGGLKPGNGLEISYLLHLTDYLTFGVPLQVSVVSVGGEQNRETIGSLDFLGMYHFLPPDRKIRPMLFSGIGMATESLRNNNFQVPLGAGFVLKSGRYSSLIAHSAFRKSFSADRDNLQFGLGWHFLLNRSQDSLPFPDQDHDLVADDLDRCPAEPGPASTNGCPDTDFDGLPDLEDDCPDSPGSAPLKGCPDADMDEVPDHLDQCPQVAGPPDNMGCPVDQDTVLEVPPPPPVSDTDGDGLDDFEDDCWQEAGPAHLRGCPDRDNDGVADKLDRCPDTPGLPADFGCPLSDTDQDGTPDAADDCPDTPGPEKLSGCPDTDYDEIPDHLDQCPDLFGMPSAAGCPDDDADGVPNASDRCPDEPGTAQTDGCPDSDNDGTPDLLDKCPDAPGPVPDMGCPDSDEDGTPDHLDKCPDEAGPNEGCPAIEKIDEEFLEFAADNIQFETGRATLKAASYVVLDQVAGILVRYPRYHLSVEGHTDNVGSNEDNLVLSEERALSCLEYLLSRGIDPDRMEYRGLGAGKPIADNDSPEGRERNRRVVFTLFLK
jgi:OOP family OmpA-OmpF porin